MIIDRFHCPIQAPEVFTFDTCRSCKFFELTKTPAGPVTIRCRKNSRKKDRPAATAFESAFLLHRLGMEYHIEIIEEVTK